MQLAPSAGNARMQLAIGFGFASHWLKKWRVTCEPIKEQIKAKTKNGSKNHSAGTHHYQKCDQLPTNIPSNITKIRPSVL